MNEPAETDYRKLFEQLPGLFLVLKGDSSFTIVDASDAYLRATFTTRELLQGRGLFDVLPKEPPTTRPAASIKLRRSLEKVMATACADTMPLQRFDVLRPNAEGGGCVERFWSAVNSPIRSADGQVLYIVHSVEDVTEFVQSSRELQTDDDALRLEILHRGRQIAAANQQLREVLSQFEAVYAQGLFAGRVDLEGKVIDSNPSSLEQCGYTVADVIGKPFWECGWWNRSPDVQAWTRNAVERAIGGEPFRGVSTYFLSDGTERITDLGCMPIKDAAGNVLFVLTTGTDITDRVFAERNLHAMQILESLTQGFFSLDEEWRFTYINREAQRMLGRAANGLIGKNLWHEAPGIQGSDFEPAFRRAMEERIAPPPVVASYAEHGHWYEMRVYPASEGIAVYLQDVTDRVEAEAERDRLAAEAEHQRRMYDAALSSTPDLIYVIDIDKRLMYANDALLETLGKRRDDVIGKSFVELDYPPWHAQRHGVEIERVIASRLPVRCEILIEASEGRRVYDYIFVPVIGSSGRIAAISATARDISDRKAAEQAIQDHADALRAADQAKDEFLATLAHELRNPLAPLRNALHLVRAKGAATADTAPLFDLMDRQLHHLIRLVDDLLEMSRITRGTFTLRKERIRIGDVIRHAIDTSRPLIESAQHTLSVALPEEPLWLDGDPVRLAQVIANLLNNAARYTNERGRIFLQVAQKGDTAEISVIDTGIGIDRESLPHVFELFNRGTANDSLGSGLGIGLSLARRLAEMHGGSVDAYSAGSGKGSRFVVRLPLLSTALPTVENESRDRAEPTPAPAGKLTRILVVDDNRDAAVTLAMILQSFGAETDIAGSGAEALEKIQRESPRIVFLDIGMPKMDGYEVARRIRRDHPLPQPVLVALTGWGQREDREKAQQAGFDHHVVKPADLRVLRELIESLSPRDAITK